MIGQCHRAVTQPTGLSAPWPLTPSLGGLGSVSDLLAFLCIILSLVYLLLVASPQTVYKLQEC